MRNFHSGFVDHFRAVEENIEIDQSRTARDQLLAAEIAFDALKPFEQLSRRKRSIGGDGAIQKPWLFEKINRLGFIQRRAAQNLQPGLWQCGDGAFQIGRAIAEV